MQKSGESERSSGMNRIAGVGGLRKALEGAVLAPDEPGYDAARAVWNGRFDRRPALIARCATAADVAAAVGFARRSGLRLAVKGGGHDYAGNSSCDGGLLIDLGAMKSVSIYSETRRARVQPGVTWGEFDRAAQAFGLAITGGTVSTVGVSGFTLGGGEGWLSRKFGLALDNLVSAEAVIASGERVRASERQNPDLFWAIRGGGGNFGIVTSFEYSLHSVGPEVYGGLIFHPFDRAGELLRFYRDYFTSADDEAVCYAFILRIPPTPDFPQEMHGELSIVFALFHAGPAAEGEKALAPFRSLGEPIADTLAPIPYLALQQAFDAGMRGGGRWYTRAHYFNELTDEAIDAALDRLQPFPGEFTSVYFGPQGGAVSRKPSNATAFPHRSAAHGMHVFPGWVDPARDGEIMAWARRLSDAMAPFGNGGVYVNLLAEDEKKRVSAAYGGNYDRLAELKKHWDPDNLFRTNHNIEPQA